MTAPVPDPRRMRRVERACPAQTVRGDAPGDVPFAGDVGVTVTMPARRGAMTGLMLLVHGMGSDDTEHDELSLRWSDRYDVVALQVRDRQSGAAGLEVPYDLGKHQTIDCLRAVEWACSTLALDRRRVLAWGGSGGGHVALLALCHAPHVFAAGVACAAITHPTMPGEIDAPEWQDGWMRRCIPLGEVPEDEITVRSPVRLAPLVRAPVALLHGTADDVVACAHSERLAAVLPGAVLHRLEGADHAFRGGPPGCTSRADATEALADDLLRRARRTAPAPAPPFAVRLAPGWVVAYDERRMPSLRRTGRR